jgi:hypothetical protein
MIIIKMESHSQDSKTFRFIYKTIQQAPNIAFNTHKDKYLGT